MLPADMDAAVTGEVQVPQGVFGGSIMIGIFTCFGADGDPHGPVGTGASLH
ncbi:MAG TPA: hypothetical protein VGB36_12655 [Gammaproteobacteria bacterium]|jgi:hypothetical protein